MPLRFVLNQRLATTPSNTNVVELLSDNWDDYSFKTLFTARIYHTNGSAFDLGNVKIGYFGQQEGRTLDSLIPLAPSFDELPENYFSLGQSPDYYARLMEIPADIRIEYLRSMRDVVYDEMRERSAVLNSVYSVSLLRSVSPSAIDGQFRRILGGGKILTEYRFNYVAHHFAPAAGPMDMHFAVVPYSLPPTNIHVLIGRNGVGKTTLLNSMVGAIIENRPPLQVGAFDTQVPYLARAPMQLGYFSGVISVAFSAFDPFEPIPDQPDRSRGVSYFYIGLKKKPDTAATGEFLLKSPTELRAEFVASLKVCFGLELKRQHWHAAISALESDENFREMELSSLALDGARPIKENLQLAENIFRQMSSGHKIVLFTMTRLVETVEEKSLVLLDEPEGHLHPPLLSAFTRALSALLTTLNAVAIVATHSPVVVQEVPSSCVWKIRRFHNSTKAERPEGETFGENVGSLTREIFGLEVSKSGFHAMLAKSAQQGGSFDSILRTYGDQIGLEGQAVLRALISSRDN